MNTARIINEKIHFGLVFPLWFDMSDFASFIPNETRFALFFIGIFVFAISGIAADQLRYHLGMPSLEEEMDKRP